MSFAEAHDSATLRCHLLREREGGGRGETTGVPTGGAYRGRLPAYPDVSRPGLKLRSAAAPDWELLRSNVSVDM